MLGNEVVVLVVKGGVSIIQLVTKILGFLKDKNSDNYKVGKMSLNKLQKQSNKNRVDVRTIDELSRKDYNDLKKMLNKEKIPITIKFNKDQTIIYWYEKNESQIKHVLNKFLDKKLNSMDDLEAQAFKDTLKKAEEKANEYNKAHEQHNDKKHHENSL